MVEKRLMDKCRDDNRIMVLVKCRGEIVSPFLMVISDRVMPQHWLR